MILSKQQYDQIVCQEQRNVEHWHTTVAYDEFQSRRLKLDQNALFRYEFASSLYLFSPDDYRDDGHYCICDCRAEGGDGQNDSCWGGDSSGNCRRNLVSHVLEIQGLANGVLSDCRASWLLLFDINGSDFDSASPKPVVGIGQACFVKGLKKAAEFIRQSPEEARWLRDIISERARLCQRAIRSVVGGCEYIELQRSMDWPLENDLPITSWAAFGSWFRSEERHYRARIPISNILTVRGGHENEVVAARFSLGGKHPIPVMIDCCECAESIPICQSHFDYCG